MSADETREVAASTQHILKVVAPYFGALLDGSKTFEVRRNDRGFQRGDTLLLWEYDGSPGRWKTYQPSLHRAVRAEVGFVYSGDPRFTYGGVDALAPGHVVLALVNVEPVNSPAHPSSGGAA